MIKLLLGITALNAFVEPLAARKRLARLKRTGITQMGFEVALTHDELRKLEESGALQILVTAKQRLDDMKVLRAA